MVAASNQIDAPYDLVLMDLQMPEMDGVAATVEIRLDTRNAQLPIAAMTANAMQDDRDRCAQAGMNGFVVKPIEPDELWYTLSHLIRPRAGLGQAPDSVFPLWSEQGSSVPLSEFAALSGEVVAEVEVPTLPILYVYPEELKETKRITAFRDFIVSKAKEWSF